MEIRDKLYHGMELTLNKEDKEQIKAAIKSMENIVTIADDNDIYNGSVQILEDASLVLRNLIAYGNVQK